MQIAREIGGTDPRPVTLHRGCSPAGLSLRPATAADSEFLLTLFAEARPELESLPSPLRTQLVRMQFDCQLAQYRARYPDAVDWIVDLECDGRVEPVGRCYLSRGTREHRLLDLATGCRWRRRGVAGALLTTLCADAAQAGVPLRLTVWRANHDAMRLYRRAGFVIDEVVSGDDGELAGLAGYQRLRWSAEAAR